jgi:hypothetical protein
VSLAETAANGDFTKSGSVAVMALVYRLSMLAVNR